MGRHVLVCDQEPHVTRAIALQLDRAGFEVHTTNDGRAAWELLQRIQPALLICSDEMPGLNGCTLAELVRETPEFAALPVMLLTSQPDRWQGRDSRETDLQIDQVVAKPFSPRQLARQVTLLVREPVCA